MNTFRNAFSTIAHTAKHSKMSFTVPATMKSWRLHGTGESLDVISYDDVDTPKISDDELLVKNKYTGVNFIEKYFRIGLYPSEKPYAMGREASGEVVQVGKNVKGYEPGDFIAYGSGATFAQYTKFNPSVGRAFKLDKDVSEEKLKTYGGLFVQGLTALTFLKDAYEVKKGDYILVHAAAGGVGLLMCQLIKLRGGHVIATASTSEKLQLAKDAGAEYLINYTSEDVTAKVKEITGGKGVAGAFDSVGKDTFEITLASLANKGTFVSFGNASGPVPPLSIARLSAKNIKLCRPVVFGYLADDADWAAYSSELKELVDSGKLKLDIFKTYALEDYKQAATDLEGRKTTGKLVLEVKH